MKIIVLLAILGIGDSTYLIFNHILGTDACGPGNGCNAVLNSSYSNLFGINLSFLGLGFYLFLLKLALTACKKDSTPKTGQWVYSFSFLGLLFSAYLVYIQAFVLEHWCLFCLFSSGLVLSIFLLSLRERLVKSQSILPFLFPNWVEQVKPMLLLIALPVVLLLFLSAIEDRLSASVQWVDSDSDAFVIGTIGDETITLKQINDSLSFWEKQQQYENRLKLFERMILRREAAAKDTTMEKLIEESIDSELPPEEQTLQFREYIENLKQAYEANVVMPEPKLLLSDPNPRSGPEKGPKDAPITIIEFSDFTCSNCARAHFELKDFLEKHSDNIRFIYKQFPHNRPGRGDALMLADAAACVSLESEEAFWMFSDLLFSTEKELSESDVYGHIEQLDINIDNYKDCLESGKGRALVKADMAEGKDLGVLWTPSFIINGRMFVGWPGERVMEKLIEKKSDSSTKID